MVEKKSKRAQKAYLKKYYRENRERLKEYYRLKYHNNPEYKRKTIENDAKRRKRRQEKERRRRKKRGIPYLYGTLPVIINGKRYYPMRFLSNFIGKSRHTIRMWEKRGIIPCYWFKGRRFYTYSLIKAIKYAVDSLDGEQLRVKKERKFKSKLIAYLSVEKRIDF